MPELPAALTYGYVVGQYLLAVADTTRDADRLPDPVAATGSVRFEPMATSIRTAGALSPVVIPQNISTQFDGDGFVVDPTGARGLWLITGSYRVTFQILGVPLPSFVIYVESNHTFAAPLDLGAETPWVPAPHEVFVVNQAVLSETLAARDEAVDVVAAVGYVVDPVTRQLRPESIPPLPYAPLEPAVRLSTDPDGFTVITIPAGSTAATFTTNTNGDPVLSLTGA